MIVAAGTKAGATSTLMILSESMRIICVKLALNRSNLLVLESKADMQKR